MLLPEIEWDACITSEICEAIKVCKTRAIVRLDPEDPPYIEHALCSSCGECIMACPYSAITLKNNLGLPGLRH
jgi:MinD superfamily P-loop ATPase